MQRVAGRRAGGPAHAAGSRRVANHTGGGGGVSGTASHGEWAAGATRRVPSECPAQKGYCSFLLHQLQTRVSIANRVCQWWFHAVTGSCRLGLPPPTVPVGGGAGRYGGGPGGGAHRTEMQSKPATRARKLGGGEGILIRVERQRRRRRHSRESGVLLCQTYNSRSNGDTNESTPTRKEFLNFSSSCVRSLCFMDQMLDALPTARFFGRHAPVKKESMH